VFVGQRVRLQDFDRDLAIELGIERQINLTHPACAPSEPLGVKRRL
jgi:hypothetical protein